MIARLLLIGFVCFGVLLLRHIAATKKVPTLCVLVIGRHRLLKEVDGPILCLVSAALLMMQPAKLLEDLRVVGRVLQDSLVSSLSAVKLRDGQLRTEGNISDQRKLTSFCCS